MKKLPLLDLSNEARDHMIEVGSAVVEDFLEAKKEYESFAAKLATDWPPEKIREKITTMLRAKYAFLIEKRKKLDRENTEARMNGVPFKERHAVGQKIASLERVLTKVRHVGTQWARTGKFEPLAYADLPLIEKCGMEWYLKYIFVPAILA